MTITGVLLAPLHAEVLTYIRKHVPDCAWNEKLGKLVFEA